VKWPVIALVFAAAIYGTAYVMRLPESNCANSNVSELWASDHAYKATLIKKDCNMGEAFIFSVRVDAYAPPLTRAWFTPGYELDNDSYRRAFLSCDGPPLGSSISRLVPAPWLEH
jgi:hypothetical protein